MTNENDIRLDDEKLAQVSGGTFTLGEVIGIKCPICGQALPKGSGGVMTDGEDGKPVLQFECTNAACRCHYYEVYFSDHTPTGRVWDYNGKRI